MWYFKGVTIITCRRTVNKARLCIQVQANWSTVEWQVGQTGWGVQWHHLTFISDLQYTFFPSGVLICDVNSQVKYFYREPCSSFRWKAGFKCEFLWTFLVSQVSLLIQGIARLFSASHLKNYTKVKLHICILYFTADNLFSSAIFTNKTWRNILDTVQNVLQNFIRVK